jgi:Glutathione S-transferase, N-terminal domain
MRLYVCYGTFPSPRPGGHPCRNAHEALVEAGYDPEVKRAYGLGPLPDVIQSPRRKEIKRMTGNAWVPTLVLDDGEIVDGSEQIIAWAKANPAGAETAKASA